MYKYICGHNEKVCNPKGMSAISRVTAHLLLCTYTLDTCIILSLDKITSELKLAQGWQQIRQYLQEFSRYYYSLQGKKFIENLKINLASRFQDFK